MIPMSRRTQRTLRRFVVFLVICTLTAVVSVATAQRSGKKPATGKKPPTTQPEGGKPDAPKPESRPLELRDGGGLSASAAGGGAGGASGGGGATETRTGDGGVKSFRFEEVAIEGRLQSPELVYFLRRVRAEFNAGDLGHRSFTGELSDTKRDPNLR
jgi:hypothetical protein